MFRFPSMQGLSGLKDPGILEGAVHPQSAGAGYSPCLRRVLTRKIPQHIHSRYEEERAGCGGAEI